MSRFALSKRNVGCRLKTSLPSISSVSSPVATQRHSVSRTVARSEATQAPVVDDGNDANQGHLSRLRTVRRGLWLSNRQHCGQTPLQES